MKITSILLCLSLLIVSVPFAFAQTNSTFKVESLVSDGNKSKEVATTLSFSENSFKTTDRKTNTVQKEFNFSDIKAADYSYAKKPLLSTGGAIASVIFLDVFALPMLFMKKKQHRLSVRTENDYVVMKLDQENFRQILNEFEIHKVEIKSIDEESEKKMGE